MFLAIKVWNCFFLGLGINQGMMMRQIIGLRDAVVGLKELLAAPTDWSWWWKCCDQVRCDGWIKLNEMGTNKCNGCILHECLNVLFWLSGFRTVRSGSYLKLLTKTEGEQTEHYP